MAASSTITVEANELVQRHIDAAAAEIGRLREENNRLRSLLASAKPRLEEHQDTATGQSEALRNLIAAICRAEGPTLEDALMALGQRGKTLAETIRDAQPQPSLPVLMPGAR